MTLADQLLRKSNWDDPELAVLHEELAQAYQKGDQYQVMSTLSKLNLHQMVQELQKPQLKVNSDKKANRAKVSDWIGILDSTDVGSTTRTIPSEEQMPRLKLSGNVWTVPPTKKQSSKLMTNLDAQQTLRKLQTKYSDRYRNELQILPELRATGDNASKKRLSKARQRIPLLIPNPDSRMVARGCASVEKYRPTLVSLLLKRAVSVEIPKPKLQLISLKQIVKDQIDRWGTDNLDPIVESVSEEIVNEPEPKTTERKRRTPSPRRVKDVEKNPRLKVKPPVPKFFKTPSRKGSERNSSVGKNDSYEIQSPIQSPPRRAMTENCLETKERENTLQRRSTQIIPDSKEVQPDGPSLSFGSLSESEVKIADNKCEAPFIEMVIKNQQLEVPEPISPVLPPRKPSNSSDVQTPLQRPRPQAAASKPQRSNLPPLIKTESPEASKSARKSPNLTSKQEKTPGTARSRSGSNSNKSNPQQADPTEPKTPVALTSARSKPSEKPQTSLDRGQPIPPNTKNTPNPRTPSKQTETKQEKPQTAIKMTPKLTKAEKEGNKSKTERKLSSTTSERGSTKEKKNQMKTKGLVGKVGDERRGMEGKGREGREGRSPPTQQAGKRKGVSRDSSPQPEWVEADGVGNARDKKVVTDKAGRVAGGSISKTGFVKGGAHEPDSSGKKVVRDNLKEPKTIRKPPLPVWNGRASTNVPGQGKMDSSRASRDGSAAVSSEKESARKGVEIKPVSLEKAIKQSILNQSPSKSTLNLKPATQKSAEVSKSKSSHVLELSRTKTTLRSERKLFPTEKLHNISLTKVDEDTPSSRLRALLKAMKQEVWIKQSDLDAKMHEEYHHLYEVTHHDKERMEAFREAVFRCYSLRQSRASSPNEDLQL